MRVYGLSMSTSAAAEAAPQTPDPDGTTPAPDGTIRAPEPPLPLWRSGPYLAWLLSDTGQALGSALQFFLVPLLVVLVTGDAAAAGTVAAVGLGGRVATTLLGGVLAAVVGVDLAALLVVPTAAAGGAVGGVSIARRTYGEQVARLTDDLEGMLDRLERRDG